MKKPGVVALYAAVVVALLVLLLLAADRAWGRREGHAFAWRELDEAMPAPGLVAITREGCWEYPPSWFVPIAVDRDGNLALLSEKGHVPINDRRISSAFGRRDRSQRGIVLFVAADARVQALVPAYELANRQEASVEYICRFKVNGTDTFYTNVNGGFLPFMMGAVPSDAMRFELFVEPKHARFRGDPVSPSEFRSAIHQLSRTLPRDCQWFVHMRVREGTLVSYMLEYAAACTSEIVRFMLTLEE